MYLFFTCIIYKIYKMIFDLNYRINIPHFKRLVEVFIRLKEIFFRNFKDCKTIIDINLI